MKCRLLLPILGLACVLILSGCCFHREWKDATCIVPKTCENCGKTEGEPLDHDWADATCTDPEICTRCGATQQLPLGHNWEAATTETPQTCKICGETEGGRLVTDPRFTTASTKALHGRWVSHIALPADTGPEGFEMVLKADITLELGTDGSLTMTCQVTNGQEYIDALMVYSEESLYRELEAMGLNKAAADEVMVNTYGMNVHDYVVDSFSKQDHAALLEPTYHSGVYYVADGQICFGDSWDSEMTPEEYTLAGDTLVVTPAISGLTDDAITFTRAAQS